MAHDVDAPPDAYAAAAAARAAIGLPSLLLVKDPGGLYISENVSDEPGTLLSTTCLFVQWAIDEMGSASGPEGVAELLEALLIGCRYNARQWKLSREKSAK